MAESLWSIAILIAMVIDLSHRLDLREEDIAAGIDAPQPRGAVLALWIAVWFLGLIVIGWVRG